MRGQLARLAGAHRRNRPLRATLGSVIAGGGLQLTIAASGILAARLLGVTDRGHLALLWVVTLVIGQLGTLGLHVGITYAIASGEPPGAVIHQLRYVIVAQLLATPIVAFIVDWALFRDVRGLGWGALASTLAVPPSFVLLLYGLAVVQGQRRYKAVQLHRLAQPSLYVVVLAVLAATGEGRLRAVTVGWSATMVFGGLFAWRQGLGRWKPVRSEAPLAAGHDARALLRFSLRSLFSAFGVIEHLQADQLLSGLLLSATQFGLYAAGTAFANLPRFLGQSIGYVAYPEVSAADRDRKRSTVLRFVLLGVLVITPVVALLVATVPWLLPALLGHRFRPAVPVAQILLAGALLQAVRRVAAEGLRGLGGGMTATLAELLFIAVFVGALGPLTSALHAKGAALAIVLASAAALLALLILSVRDVRATADRGVEIALPGPTTAANPGEGVI